MGNWWSAKHLLVVHRELVHHLVLSLLVFSSFYKHLGSLLQRWREEKTFSRVPHKTFLWKLSSHRLRGKVLSHSHWQWQYFCSFCSWWIDTEAWNLVWSRERIGCVVFMAVYLPEVLMCQLKDTDFLYAKALRVWSPALFANPHKIKRKNYLLMHLGMNVIFKNKLLI